MQDMLQQQRRRGREACDKAQQGSEWHKQGREKEARKKERENEKKDGERRFGGICSEKEKIKTMLFSKKGRKNVDEVDIKWKPETAS